jgi:peptidoglycan/LPS O-acetylase OafA/YrhL
MLEGHGTAMRAPDGNKDPGRRMQFLDVTRGIAALAVVLEHGSEHLFPGYLKAANSYFTLGVFGVSTFFLVSGFIIPVSIERHRALSGFWQARVFRLYPMYWFSIFAGLALQFSAGVPLMFGAHPWRGILVNMTMFQSFVGVPNLSGLYWTLTMEMIFYLLCSALFLAGLLSRSLVWVWVGALVNLAATMGWGLCFHRSLPAGRTALIMSAFFGTLLYRHYRTSLALKVILQVTPILVLSILCGFWFRFHQFPSSDQDEAFKFVGVSLSYLGSYSLFAVLYWQRDRTFPLPLLWLGRISYSLYLMHGLALAAIPPGEYPLIRLGAIVLVAVLIASTTFVIVERPALALHQRLSRSENTSSLPSLVMSTTSNN